MLTPTPPLALRTLLHGVVDYAGLFPPASLAMGAAVRDYDAYRSSVHRWMLGRLVVPAARLEEMEAAASGRLPGVSEDDDAVEPWRISALVSADVAGDVERLRAFDARHAADAPGGRATVDAVELKAASPEELERCAALLPRALDAYVEIPLGGDVAGFVAAARRAGVRLKARTGGVTPDAFPAPEAVLRFLALCARHDVPAKATAGLHHPLRGEHALTYEPGCPHGTMFGFLQVFAAAALLRAGVSPATLLPLLDDRDPRALTFDDTALHWRGQSADVTTIAATRARGLVAFGSCSFEEPIADLRALELM